MILTCGYGSSLAGQGFTMIFKSRTVGAPMNKEQLFSNKLCQQYDVSNPVMHEFVQT